MIFARHLTNKRYLKSRPLPYLFTNCRLLTTCV